MGSLRRTAIVLVAGTGVYVLTRRLWVGRQEDRRFVEWLTDPADVSKMAGWLKTHPVLPGDVDDCDWADDRANARIDSGMRTIIAQARGESREAA